MSVLLSALLQVHVKISGFTNLLGYLREDVCIFGKAIAPLG